MDLRNLPLKVVPLDHDYLSRTSRWRDVSLEVFHHYKELAEWSTLGDRDSFLVRVSNASDTVTTPRQDLKLEENEYFRSAQVPIEPIPPGRSLEVVLKAEPWETEVTLVRQLCPSARLSLESSVGLKRKFSVELCVGKQTCVLC